MRTYAYVRGLRINAKNRAYLQETVDIFIKYVIEFRRSKSLFDASQRCARPKYSEVPKVHNTFKYCNIKHILWIWKI